MYKRFINTLVGLFMMAGVAGLLMLAYKVSSFSSYESDDSYVLTAEFDNVGGLKVRAPVAIGGVKIGQVDSIVLDPTTFKAKVSMSIDDKVNDIPVDTSASILTQGLLGSNYISFMPGFSTESLKEGGEISTTHSALVLENLIGQLMFKLNNSDNSNSSASNSTSAPTAASSASTGSDVPAVSSSPVSATPANSAVAATPSASATAPASSVEINNTSAAKSN